jgi:hypothetical protein
MYSRTTMKVASKTGRVLQIYIFLQSDMANVELEEVIIINLFSLII